MPVLLILLGILTCGIAIAFSQSIGYFPIIGLKEITLKYYIEIIKDKEFINSLKFSLYISFISSILAVIVGVLFSYLIFESKHKEKIEKYIFKIPIIVPHIVVALLMANILSQSGIIARTLYFFGIIDKQTDFVSLIYDKNGFGIIITYLWKEIPFVGMVVYSIFENISNALCSAALNLGANKRQVFWHILLPLAMPSILSIFIIIFSFSFGAFEVPYLLGPTSPKTLPVNAYIEYTNPDLSNRPYAMAINMILIIASIILVLIYEKIFNIMYKNNR